MTGPDPKEALPRLREHRPGDLGWIVQRHGELYHRAYGWNQEFEALTAEIVARFVRELEPRREGCWIAERPGGRAAERVGSVMLVRHAEEPEEVAQLRLLLVEPSARGLGVGSRLVSRCTDFACEAGFRRIRLWTEARLDAARRIYEREGYVHLGDTPRRSFGQDVLFQDWELVL